MEKAIYQAAGKEETCLIIEKLKKAGFEKFEDCASFDIEDIKGELRQAGLTGKKMLEF